MKTAKKTLSSTQQLDALHRKIDADKLFEKSVSAPAVMLDKTLEMGTKVTQKPLQQATAGVKRAKDYWHALGPGLTTGASDDDPSGIATYSQAGAQYGYKFLWLAPLTFPLMGVVQEMCARIGMVTGQGLAANIRTHYSHRVLRFVTLLLFAANTFNIGADLGALAKAVQLLNPHLGFGFLVCAFTVLTLGLQIFTPYEKYARYLKWLALVLLSYVVSALLARLNWGQIFHATIMPEFHISKDSLLLICGILGTTISPYLFFWQTSQEVEESIAQGKTTIAARRSATAPEDMKRMRVIVAACGGILFPHGITEITSAAQAAEALRPFAGDATYWLFAIGIIGVGLLGIPVLAGSSSYAIAESLKLKTGLHKTLRQAHAFYGIIIVSMLVGLALNFVGLDPMKALIYSAVLNGIVAPFVLFFIVKIGSNRRVMGHWVNGRFTTLLGWATTLLMAVAGTAAIWSLF
jgi:Mn2+/Fe2+ NRAMP family transporter